MTETLKAFAELTAADVMSRDVVVVPQDMDLRTAAQLLSRARITGAPVIDGRGRCVGVVSATDFIHWAEDLREERCRAPQCVCADWQVIESANLPAAAVSQYMTADPVTATTTTALADLARMMVDAHIHRVIIVDEQRRPVGVVSSTDILAAVAS
jgi:CBS domain-containing membrane protein